MNTCPKAAIDPIRAIRRQSWAKAGRGAASGASGGGPPGWGPPGGGPPGWGPPGWGPVVGGSVAVMCDPQPEGAHRIFRRVAEAALR
ncbi:MAG: hypothetical protein F4Z06_09800 [Acidimicrobiia bacterium]|nr:hypothetical protein [Acidimicrobiia bacterium]